MGERARIAFHFARLTCDEPGAYFLKDDAAVLVPPAGKQLVITTDSVIQAIHVLADATPQQFAQKLVRRNLSDLAAMGAEPWRYTLNLHTPTGLGDEWFAAFAAALDDAQKQYGMVLVGGDSTSGSAVIHTTMTCFGLLPAKPPYPHPAGDEDDGLPLSRLHAWDGDDIYVSGTVGDAALALFMLQQQLPVGAALAARYHLPEPRLELGQRLRGIADAATDISDGLVADLTRICEASYTSATILREALPLSKTLQHLVQQDSKNWRFALSGGDDYELLFTASPTQRAAIQSLAIALNLPLTPIGTMEEIDRVAETAEVVVIDEEGKPLPIGDDGWEYR